MPECQWQSLNSGHEEPHTIPITDSWVMVHDAFGDGVRLLCMTHVADLILFATCEAAGRETTFTFHA